MSNFMRFNFTTWQWENSTAGPAGPFSQVTKGVLGGDDSAKPAAGIVDRIYFAFDTGVVYVDDGTNWNVLIGNFGTAAYVDTGTGDTDVPQNSYLENIYPHIYGEQSLDVTVAGWVTIAEASTGRAYGEFIVYDTDNGKNNLVKLIAMTSYGKNVISPLAGIRYSGATIANARALYLTADRTYGGSKLQVYITSVPCTLRVRAMMVEQINRWDQWTVQTPVREGLPDGWTEDADSVKNDITNPLNY